MPESLRDVPGLRVGHWTDAKARTGVTVVLAPDGGATAGVDVRGSAPGTRETDLLRPTALVERAHAICLAGGSAFGLAAADGVMRRLAERGVGFATPVRPIPIVPTAILFDLGVGSPIAPDADAGYAATRAAEANSGALEGALGAGTGATVAKLGGTDGAVAAGVGSAARRLPDGTVVGALVVNNALGSVHARDGRILAGASPGAAQQPPTGNTVLVIIGTDAPLDRAACRHLAELGHDAIAIGIRPAHTMFDGDVVFALSTGETRAPEPAALTGLGAAAVDAVGEAIERSIAGSAG